jgi:hypothetical protein
MEFFLEECLSYIDRLYIIIERSASGGNRTHILTTRVIQNSVLLTNHSATEALLWHWQIRLYMIQYLRFYSVQTPKSSKIQVNWRICHWLVTYPGLLGWKLSSNPVFNNCLRSLDSSINPLQIAQMLLCFINVCIRW